ncbi:MAG: peptidyl-alpha-hydroxyglycine alpha-amidating lyase family protein [Verrucomicrobia bacterium]|nr:peptidyl-alpha-hydroxyglycine alpha-amidating lyase family protein [Verrucomicrobiota bacterium]MDA1067275.1 peptidyl-alpha-hydroxyglycine alpha-amidating lyase family protein [Verrucomicrobiota bacterium]
MTRRILFLLFISVLPLLAQPELAYKPVKGWGTLPADYVTGAGMAVSVAGDGSIWYYTRSALPVMQFTKKGKLLQAWPEDIALSNHQGAAHGMGIGPDGGVWLVDRETHTIFKFSKEGRTLLTIGSFGAKQGTDDTHYAFNRPAGVAFDSQGNAYVADGYKNTRVAKYSPDGDYITHWGGQGDAPGLFNLVHGLTLDDRDRIYVADRGNKRIQVFDKNGKFLAKWDGLGTPWNVAFDLREKVIWMCDGDVGRVQKLSLKGKVLGGFGSSGQAPGQLHQVHSLAVDDEGAIYTAETVNQRIQKFVLSK